MGIRRGATGATTWVRPTPRPAVDTTTELINFSNMPGGDVAPSVAVHPTDGWAAAIWANVPPDDPDDATVFVKVQDSTSHIWQPGIGISTAPAYSFASHPDIAIDAQGRIHAVFGQAGLRPHYSRSEDFGRTWTTPEALPLPGGGNGIFLRITVDPAGIVHVLASVAFRIHLWERAADAPRGSAWQRVDDLFDGADQIRSAMAFPDGRMLVVAAVGDHPAVAVRASSTWQQHIPAGSTARPGASVNWVSIVAVPHGACIAWGYYARSANFSSCSFDGGDTWEAAKPIIETPDVPDYTNQDTGSTPELVYDPATHIVMSVQLYRQAGEPMAIFPVYSYRRLVDDHWVPDIAGPYAHHQPALRLFPATRRSLAGTPHGLRVASTGSGLAVATWIEVEGDENLEMYLGWFHPAALLAEVQ